MKTLHYCEWCKWFTPSKNLMQLHFKIKKHHKEDDAPIEFETRIIGDDEITTWH